MKQRLIILRKISFRGNDKRGIFGFILKLYSFGISDIEFQGQTMVEVIVWPCFLCGNLNVRVVQMVKKISKSMFRS